jgi:hypothetical protein
MRHNAFVLWPTEPDPDETIWSTVALTMGMGQPKGSEKILPMYNLYTKNATWTYLGMNPGFHGEKLVTELCSGFAILIL